MHVGMVHSEGWCTCGMVCMEVVHMGEWCAWGGGAHWGMVHRDGVAWGVMGSQLHKVCIAWGCCTGVLHREALHRGEHGYVLLL